ncbi:unnamed protein product, partial [Onchocerca flexuosa]|uniref:TAXi_C domain-containing protein n=1 Tax=Onchocerca flexuosa TaxID=387005 RepID=A0A183H8G6_9BILA
VRYLFEYHLNCNTENKCSAHAVPSDLCLCCFHGSVKILNFTISASSLGILARTNSLDTGIFMPQNNITIFDFMTPDGLVNQTGKTVFKGFSKRLWYIYSHHYLAKSRPHPDP